MPQPDTTLREAPRPVARSTDAATRPAGALRAWGPTVLVVACVVAYLVLNWPAIGPPVAALVKAITG